MFGFVDTWVEAGLKKLLHKRREPIISKATAIFSERHPEADLQGLIVEFNSEADRIYAIVDRSILRERIKRAKYTFWATGTSAVIIVGMLGGFSAKAVLPFIAPPLTALATWMISLCTIPVSYNQRIKGAMDSVIVKVESRMQERAQAQLALPPPAPDLALNIRDEMKVELEVVVPAESRALSPVKGIQFWKKTQDEKTGAESLELDSMNNKEDVEAAVVTFHLG